MSLFFIKMSSGNVYSLSEKAKQENRSPKHEVKEAEAKGHINLYRENESSHQFDIIYEITANCFHITLHCSLPADISLIVKFSGYTVHIT